MANNQELSDDLLIRDIASGGTARHKAIQEVYDNPELKKMVAAFVRNHGGNAEDGLDVFHEGIIVLDRNLREGKFRGETSLSGYLYSICRFVWMNQARRQARITHTDQMPEPTPGESAALTPDRLLMDEERSAALNQLLNTIGERCRRILELWKLSYSMEEIAEKEGLSSAEMAKKAKYRCHVALLEKIRQNPNWEQLIR